MIAKEKKVQNSQQSYHKNRVWHISHSQPPPQHNHHSNSQSILATHPPPPRATTMTHNLPQPSTIAHKSSRARPKWSKNPDR